MSDKLIKSEAFFTPEQRRMILDSFLNGASESEAAVLLELARLRRLNPILGQIHFIKRWDSALGDLKWSAQVGIDGLRALAASTGLYDGQDEPAFTYKDKSSLPATCRVAVYRKDVSRPFVGLAHFSEYVQIKKNGEMTSMWANRPHIMLQKCAEALALRKAFPGDMSGLEAPEEINSDESGDSASITPPPAQSRHSLPSTPAAMAPSRRVSLPLEKEPCPAPLAPDPSPYELPEPGSDIGEEFENAPDESREILARIEKAETLDELKMLVADAAKIPEPGKAQARRAYIERRAKLAVGARSGQ